MAGFEVRNGQGHRYGRLQHAVAGLAKRNDAHGVRPRHGAQALCQLLHGGQVLLNVIKHIGDVAGTDQQFQFAGADSQRSKRRPAKLFDELHYPVGGNKHPGHHGLLTGGAEFEIKKAVSRPHSRSRCGFGRRHRGHQHLEICRGMHGDAQA